MTIRQLALVHSFNKRYANPVSVAYVKHKKLCMLALMSGMSHDDLRQLAYVGVLNAARLYDPERGSFDNFAHIHIRAEIGNTLRKTPFVRLMKLDKSEWSDSASDVDLANIPGGVHEPRLDVRRNGIQFDVSINGARLNFWEEDTLAVARKVLTDLATSNPKGRRIATCVLLRFGFIGGRTRTYSEIGRKYKVSKSMAQQLVETGLALIKSKLQTSALLQQQENDHVKRHSPRRAHV